MRIEKVRDRIGKMKGKDWAFLYFIFYIFTPISYRAGVDRSSWFLLAGMASLLLLIPASKASSLQFLGTKELWKRLCVVGMACCFILTFTHMLGMIGTWKAAGLAPATLLIVLDTSLDISDTFWLAAGVFLVFMGIWESIYNVGIYRFYHFFESAPGPARYNFVVTIFLYTWCLLVGVSMLNYVSKRHKGFFSFNSVSRYSLLLYTSCIIIWFGFNMPVAVSYLDGVGPFYYHTTYQAQTLVYMSKVALIMVFLGSVKEVKEYVESLWVSGHSYLAKHLRPNHVPSSLQHSSSQTKTHKEQSIFQS